VVLFGAEVRRQQDRSHPYRISLEQQHYAPTTINLRLAATRRLAYEAADCGLLSAELAAGTRRVKAAKRLRTPVRNCFPRRVSVRVKQNSSEKPQYSQDHPCDSHLFLLNASQAGCDLPLIRLNREMSSQSCPACNQILRYSLDCVAAVYSRDSRRFTQMKPFITAVCLVVLFAGAKLQAQAPSDPQIVQIVQTANQIDITQARLALKKSSNSQVKDFANQMISDHQALMNSVADLAKKLNVIPQESDTSKQLKQQADDESKKLRGLTGSDFDKEYAAHEIAYHQAVIDAASKVLIPNAKNAELKSALEGAAPLLQGHKEHAQHLQESLQGGK
jgi:putative membrane protein